MALTWYSEAPGGGLLRIRVQPRAGRTEIAGVHGDRLRIRIAAPPVDGAANREVVRFLARRLRLPRSAVEIRSGHKGRTKSIWVRGLDARAAASALAPEG
ncbi:DUF167 domain-containing protein [Candidatus Palauibacter sp.]|uniref:DUF167 domain-containing protein n=1 Tax=Candidatus Palauibacter sp. TaxID=3101350 RepID=UPI003AF28D31